MEPNSIYGDLVFSYLRSSIWVSFFALLCHFSSILIICLDFLCCQRFLFPPSLELCLLFFDFLLFVRFFLSLSIFALNASFLFILVLASASSPLPQCHIQMLLPLGFVCSICHCITSLTSLSSLQITIHYTAFHVPILAPHILTRSLNKLSISFHIHDFQ